VDGLTPGRGTAKITAKVTKELTKVLADGTVLQEKHVLVIRRNNAPDLGPNDLGEDIRHYRG